MSPRETIPPLAETPYLTAFLESGVASWNLRVLVRDMGITVCPLLWALEVKRDVAGKNEE